MYESKFFEIRVVGGDKEVLLEEDMFSFSSRSYCWLCNVGKALFLGEGCPRIKDRFSGHGEQAGMW